MLLIVISVYDIIAVNKTKHMVKLAKFQAESKVFAGLMLQYDNKKEKPTKKTKVKKAAGIKLAVLGGGDIGFPLIFAGVVMKDLMLSNPELIGFLKTLIIPLFTTLALMFLLFKGKQNKFYPAMPYLTAGCFIGYSIILLFF
jgi:presenilin-like A22 family membrane protease